MIEKAKTICLGFAHLEALLPLFAKYQIEPLTLSENNSLSTQVQLATEFQLWILVNTGQVQTETIHQLLCELSELHQSLKVVFLIRHFGEADSIEQLNLPPKIAQKTMAWPLAFAEWGAIWEWFRESDN